MECSNTVKMLATLIPLAMIFFISATILISVCGNSHLPIFIFLVIVGCMVLVFTRCCYKQITRNDAITRDIDLPKETIIRDIDLPKETITRDIDLPKETISKDIDLPNGTNNATTENTQPPIEAYSSHQAVNLFHQAVSLLQQGGYLPHQVAYPPQQATYPPQQATYFPQQAVCPPQQATCPPQQVTYPPQLVTSYPLSAQPQSCSQDSGIVNEKSSLPPGNRIDMPKPPPSYEDAVLKPAVESSLERT